MKTGFLHLSSVASAFSREPSGMPIVSLIIFDKLNAGSGDLLTALLVGLVDRAAGEGPRTTVVIG